MAKRGRKSSRDIDIEEKQIREILGEEIEPVETREFYNEVAREARLIQRNSLEVRTHSRNLDQDDFVVGLWERGIEAI